MTTEEILSNLCYYDKRNPECTLEEGGVKDNKNCSCDNCFYGLTKLAEELLKYINK